MTTIGSGPRPISPQPMGPAGEHKIGIPEDGVGIPSIPDAPAAHHRPEGALKLEKPGHLPRDLSLLILELSGKIEEGKQKSLKENIRTSLQRTKDCYHRILDLFRLSAVCAEKAEQAKMLADATSDPQKKNIYLKNLSRSIQYLTQAQARMAESKPELNAESRALKKLTAKITALIDRAAARAEEVLRREVELAVGRDAKPSAGRFYKLHKEEQKQDFRELSDESAAQRVETLREEEIQRINDRLLSVLQSVHPGDSNMAPRRRTPV